MASSLGDFVTKPHDELSRTFARTNNRSKFNVPLGVEAQGFCSLG